jgi:membrane associated rhomboid family serine protease
MFVPLHDDNPWRSISYPYVTRSLILVTSLIFIVFQSGLVLDTADEVDGALSVVPAALSGEDGFFTTVALIPEPLTYVTYMFLHGTFLHLIGNMLFFWVFGDNVEDAMGHLRFVGFYLLCGIIAAAAHTAAMPYSDSGLIGASGAVAGVLAAYLILHPRVKVWALVIWPIPLRLRAMWLIGLWIAFQFISVLVATDDGTAYWAHIGGLAAGAALIPFFRRPDVPLFDRGLAA